MYRWTMYATMCVFLCVQGHWWSLSSTVAMEICLPSWRAREKCLCTTVWVYRQRDGVMIAVFTHTGPPCRAERDHTCLCTPHFSLKVQMAPSHTYKMIHLKALLQSVWGSKMLSGLKQDVHFLHFFTGLDTNTNGASGVIIVYEMLCTNDKKHPTNHSVAMLTLISVYLINTNWFLLIWWIKGWRARFCQQSVWWQYRESPR